MKRSSNSITPRTKPAAIPTAVAPRQRLPPDERRLLILEGAVRYFAECGFEGQTRELASRLGITNALLFRYFPTKDDLIERVYQTVYLGRWRPEWEDWLKDRSQPLETRLRRFYKSYLSVINTYEWVRIFFFAGLKEVNINRRYLNILGEKIITTICSEVRHMYTLPTPAELPITRSELDAAWGLQGQVLYVCVRSHIYKQNIENPEGIVDSAIDIFLSGISRVAVKATGSAAATPR